MGLFLNIVIIWLKISFVPTAMFLIHNLEEEYSPYASLHSKVIGGVNTCLLIVTIWVFFFGVQTLWPESFMWELLENADTV